MSFDSLLGSSGAVITQPILGRVADAWSYPVSYVVSPAVQALALPFIWLARREQGWSDAKVDTPVAQRAQRDVVIGRFTGNDEQGRAFLAFPSDAGRTFRPPIRPRPDARGGRPKSNGSSQDPA
jgi:hypothetical protein